MEKSGGADCSNQGLEEFAGNEWIRHLLAATESSTVAYRPPARRIIDVQHAWPNSEVRSSRGPCPSWRDATLSTETRWQLHGLNAPYCCIDQPERAAWAACCLSRRCCACVRAGGGDCARHGDTRGRADGLPRVGAVGDACAHAGRSGRAAHRGARAFTRR
eukprot:6214821-Pleurochrysis_carterae.AAC.4